VTVLAVIVALAAGSAWAHFQVLVPSTDIVTAEGAKTVDLDIVFTHPMELGPAMGDPGCLSIFGRKAVRHRLFAEHLTAEYRVRTEGRGRTVEEWKLPAHRPDNHWLDCVVGCAAAASMQGIERIGAAVQPQGERKRLKLSELQRTRP
jgi:hypothetical protein